MTSTEQEARKSGYYRSPNNPTRWYAGGPGIPELLHWYQEIHIEHGVRPESKGYDFVRLYEYQNGRGLVWKGTFADWADYMRYVTEHGKLSAPGLPAFSNAWD